MVHFILHWIFKIMWKVWLIKLINSFYHFVFFSSVWSANKDFDITTSLISRTSALQCQAFDNREPLLYLGTSVSTVKVLHITEKRIINEAIIDKYYPRIMNLYPHTTQSRFFEKKSEQIFFYSYIKFRSSFCFISKWKSFKYNWKWSNTFRSCVNYWYTNLVNWTCTIRSWWKFCYMYDSTSESAIAHFR